MSISGFKDAITEQSTAEAVVAHEHEGAASPDTVSAASQSTDEPTKDIVSYRPLQRLQKMSEFDRKYLQYMLKCNKCDVGQSSLSSSPPVDVPLSLQVSVLLLKVRSVCVGVEVLGDSTAVALEVARVTPNQLGNVCLRQYLSSRSLGKSSAAHDAVFKQASRAALE